MYLGSHSEDYGTCITLLPQAHSAVSAHCRYYWSTWEGSDINGQDLRT